MGQRRLINRIRGYVDYLVTERICPYLYPKYAKLRAWVTRQRITHVIGDSHTQMFARQYPYIVHHLGPATAYNLGNDKSSNQSFQKLESVLTLVNKSNDQLLMVFGEIDCRIHIYKNYMEAKGRKSLLSLVKTTIANYGLVLISLRQQGYRIAVLSLPPTSKQSNIYHYKYYGDFKKRREITLLFNKELAKYCDKNKLKYVDLYPYVVDQDGATKAYYAQDIVHLNKLAVPLVTKILI